MSFQEWIDKTVSVVTSDGRNIVGILKGSDQTCNLILEGSHERIFSEERGVVQSVLGLYIIRGDNIALIAEVDEEKDSLMDLSTVKAPALKPVGH
mmetsp:Transcript_11839/g.11487  ORF Transcript_11839/g.11487 Transcript_11839/m.11487 type:complete len:95 (+) Transcript_11839:126-410(+)